MSCYLHYSFDLWLTLIRSNPAFKEQRIQYFHRFYNEKGKSIDEITQIFRLVDLMCNGINERTEKNIDADEMYLMVISMIHDNDIDLHKIDINSVNQDMDDLLFNYLPEVYSDKTIMVVESLKNKPDITLSILSNTGFIKGNTLRKVVKKLGLSIFFDFQLYSDEEGLSKPNIHLFQQVITKAGRLRKEPINFSEIVHVGDNPVADIFGAKRAGINSILINSGNGTILDLINHDQFIRTA